MVLDLPTTEGWKAELTKVTGYIQRRLTVTHPSTDMAGHGPELNSQSVDHKSGALTTTLPSRLITTSYFSSIVVVVDIVLQGLAYHCPVTTGFHESGSCSARRILGSLLSG